MGIEKAELMLGFFYNNARSMGFEPTIFAVTGRRFGPAKLRPQVRHKMRISYVHIFAECSGRKVLPYDRISINSLNLFLFLSR